MKTAISIPDSVFQAAEQLAQKLRISRSELYTRAVAAYVAACSDEHVTDSLNQLYDEEDSSLDAVIRQIQSLSLPAEDW